MVLAQRQSGQAVVESILLFVVIIGIMTASYKALRANNFIEGLTINTWGKVYGMIECGVWQPCGIATGATGLHPSNRIVSYRPQNQAEEGQ